MDKKILKRDFIIANLAGGINALAMLSIIIMQKLGVLPNPPCTFLYGTHMYCPGCGGTRAMMAFLKGHIIKSLCYNPAVLLGAVLLLYYEVSVLMTIMSRKNKVYYTKSKIPVIIYVSIVLIFAIVRDVLLVGFGIDMLGPGMFFL